VGGDILLKADRMSMAHSLELRVPFLDREVFAVASRVPVKHRIAGGTTKYAMRLAARRHMPEESTARPKLGFPVPIRIWLRKPEHYRTVREAFTSPAAQQFFHTGELLKFRDQHTTAKRTTAGKSGRCICSSSGMRCILARMPGCKTSRRAALLILTAREGICIWLYPQNPGMGGEDDRIT